MVFLKRRPTEKKKIAFRLCEDQDCRRKKTNQTASGTSDGVYDVATCLSTFNFADQSKGEGSFDIVLIPNRAALKIN